MADEHCCKVGRVIVEYDLRAPRQYTGDINDYLVAKWTGTGHHEPVGVRPLTEWLNKRILRTVYRHHDRSDTDVRIDAEYEALQSDDIAAHEREDVVADLEADGIDPDALVNDFIGKSTLDRHLKNCLSASKDSGDEATESNWEFEGIEYARGSFQDKIETALESWDRKGRLPDATEAVLETPVLLSCPHCPTRVKLETALEQGYICADHLGPENRTADSADQSDDPDVPEILQSFVT